MKVVRRLAIAIVAILVAIQLVPISRSNPPVETEIAAPEAVQHILARSCYDCHSNKTVWPWYSRVAPVSWLVSSDVSGARHKMNFTTWNQYTPREQADKVSEIWKEVDSGDMPPWYYLLEHKDARLSADDKSTLRDWTGAANQ